MKFVPRKLLALSSWLRAESLSRLPGAFLLLGQLHRQTGAVHLHRGGLLRVVRVVGTLVDLELGGHLAAELALGQHALDGFLEDLLRTANEQLAVLFLAQAAGETGVAAIELLASLHAGDLDLLGVDDDDVIAHIDIRRVERVQLARENAGGMRSEAAERLAGRVQHKPLALNVLAAGDRSRLIEVHLGYSLVLPSS